MILIGGRPISIRSDRCSCKKLRGWLRIMHWGRALDKKLDSLRLYFPAEVTGAYVALQGLLLSNGVSKTEAMYPMLLVVAGLTVVNGLIYWRLYEAVSLLSHAVLAAGFIIWAGNIDTARFKDLPLLGQYIDILAPALLIFYTLITSLIALPKRKTTDVPQ
jgi:hypothetical protein